MEVDQVLVCMNVNGEDREIVVNRRQSLADALRHGLRLTGTHVACEHGVCGACTIDMDGSPVRSCLVLAVAADGHSVRTVEALAGPDGLNELQQAFSRHHALQCGFCTPGFLMLIQSLIDSGEIVELARDRQQVRELIASNLCRCTGYEPIVDAVCEVAAVVAKER